MSEKEGPVIIDTIKVRRGGKDVFIPNLIKEDISVEAYDRIGRKKKAGPPKGKIINKGV